MRLALVSLIAIAGLAPAALAQTAATPALQPPAESMPMPMPPAPASPPATETSPAPPVAPAVPVVSPPTPPAAEPMPPAVEAPPPAPPAAPTDPTAIALLGALEKVCIPAASGGNMAQIAKSAGFRKSGDNYVLKQPGYQFTLLAPGSNPNQCHIDIVHPIDPEAPAKPLVVALHNWAVFGHGWSLYRNDKNVDAGQEFTTRSWEHSADGKAEALVITTVRKADGTPAQRNADTSMMIYSLNKTAG
jgi:hypothetical protein